MRCMPEFERQRNGIQNSHLLGSEGYNPVTTQPLGAKSPILNQEGPLGNQAAQRFAKTCPLALTSPTLCLFGGVCHTCPVRIQPKLTLSKPDDRYEREADGVAEQVMRMGDPDIGGGGTVREEIRDVHVQRSCVECDEELQRQPIEEEEEEEELQAKQTPGQTPEVTQEMLTRIDKIRGGGQPLPDEVRAFFEPRFGYDFGGVRVHSDEDSAKLAHAVNARAFTLGRDIVFGAGEYQPVTEVGQSLLAHELVHVIQQEPPLEDRNLVQRQQRRRQQGRQFAVRPVNGGIRGCDAYGCGDFGASRGNRTHQGVDLVSPVGDRVNAPCDGTIVRHSRPYANDNRYDGVLLRCQTGHDVYIWYIDVTAGVSANVRAGDQLGTTQALSLRYPPRRGGAITNHIHLQVRDGGNIVDPTNLLPPAGQYPQALPKAVEERTYVVQKGESVKDIADKFGISIEALVVTNTSMLRTWSTPSGKRIKGFNAGDTIVIPAADVALKVEREEGSGLLEFLEQIAKSLAVPLAAAWSSLSALIGGEEEEAVGEEEDKAWTACTMPGPVKGGADKKTKMDASFVAKLDNICGRMKAQGYETKIFWGYRTEAEQVHIATAGRSFEEFKTFMNKEVQKGHITAEKAQDFIDFYDPNKGKHAMRGDPGKVTWTLRSRHRTGKAADVVHPTLLWNPPEGEAYWEALKKAAEAEGLRIGPPASDKAHVQVK